MLIGVLKETNPGENRVAMIPANVKKMVRAGGDVRIEAGAGTGAGFSDADYTEAGASIADRAALLSESDLVLRLGKPTTEEISQLKSGAIHVSYLDRFN